MILSGKCTSRLNLSDASRFARSRKTSGSGMEEETVLYRSELFIDLLDYPGFYFARFFIFI